MRVAVLSNINIDLIGKYLKENLRSLEDGEIEMYFGGYGQVVEELIGESSGLYEFNPDFAIIFIDADELFRDILSNPLSYSPEDIRGIVKERVSNLFHAISKYLDICPQGYALVNTLVMAPYSAMPYMDLNTDYSPSVVELLANTELWELQKGLKNMVIVNWHSMVNRYGYNRLYDSRYWYLGRIKLSGEGLSRLAYLYSGYIKAIKGKTKKVLLLDLDNTLWGGIIGEDGLDGIELREDGIGKAYRDFQKLVKILKEQGVLLAVVSKNNPSDVDEVFEKHPMMVLKKDDFVVFKVNWSDKAQNIKEIAEELNLGLDSFVFIDDSPFEREAVKRYLPEVVVPDFPDDPSLLPGWFCEVVENYFPKIWVTEEDRKRSKMYQGEVRRKELMREFTSLEDYLRSLSMKAVISINDRRHVSRIAQLTQRTNQFNLTTRRYTEADIERFMENPEHLVFDLELIDKFGTNGITGVIIILFRKDGTALIDTFLMSCRIIGRGVEKAFLSYVVNYLKSQGVKILKGQYFPTKKNQLVSNLYGEMGFRKVEEDESHTEWEMDLSSRSVECPDWIRVEGRIEG